MIRIRSLAKRLWYFYHNVMPLTKINNYDTKNVVRLGSNYGGWPILIEKLKNDPLIVSAGVGEDISFDIELLNVVDATIILVDPTPRSKSYYDLICKNWGNTKQSEYSNDGYQKPSCYDLSNISKNNIRLIEAALWSSNGQLEFFAPAKTESVSYSLDREFGARAGKIIVPAITLKDIVQLEQREIDVLKLDIEGAELNVLESLFDTRMFPEQLLIEFDSVKYKVAKNVKTINDLHHRILNEGYHRYYTDGLSIACYYKGAI